MTNGGSLEGADVTLPNSAEDDEMGDSIQVAGDTYNVYETNEQTVQRTRNRPPKGSFAKLLPLILAASGGGLGGAGAAAAILLNQLSPPAATNPVDTDTQYELGDVSVSSGTDSK